MNSQEVYLWYVQIRNWLPTLGKWQALTLAFFSLGIVSAERCTLSKVAETLLHVGKADSVERRLQRFLANARLCVASLSVGWVRWVTSRLETARCIILVDETKLGAQLGIMVVGLAYRRCCIPLAWRCYRPTAYPAEGQVALIRTLLEQVQAGLPSPCSVLVQADRGIGTSPQLVQAVCALGWHYLFRVQKNTRFKSLKGQEHAMQQLVKPGERWHSEGWVFKKAGWLRSHICLVWERGYAEPWCLITNAPTCHGDEYGWRYWQEAAFRDLKSDGWQWQRSRVWLPDHAERLVLVLAVAYAWTLTHGTLVADAPLEVRATITRGSERIYSVFREGLRYLAHLRHVGGPMLFDLFFTVPDPLPKTVVT
jgi:hypothetical protein